MHKQHYSHLAIMTVLSFIAMLILMYAASRTSIRMSISSTWQD